MVWTTLIVLAQVAGALTAVRAIMETRTAQGSIAWAVSLITFPYVAVPAYWVFGRSRFHGYVSLRRADLIKSNAVLSKLAHEIKEHRHDDETVRARAQLLERLAKLPLTRGNDVELLIDGKATFDSMFAAIESARRYVLVQFYILRHDGLGTRFSDLLLRKAAEGVRCYVLYDELGYKVPMSVRDHLRAGGVEIAPFNTSQGPSNRFQINFRNHRKIVVVDGRVGFVGGFNIGDEYLGLDPLLSPWRDTHVRVVGPVVQCMQVAWCEDWYWATQKVEELEWTPEPSRSANRVALYLPTGPADEFETATLFFLHVIHHAQRRLWIASPYFVPGEQLVSALQAAGLRNVDVRILIPKKPDNLLVKLSGYSYLSDLGRSGVRVFRHGRGFMHQKVLLVDDDVAAVGTANFDNRSFRLNFESTLLVTDKAFACEVEAMLVADLACAEEAFASDLAKQPFWRRFAVRVARLFAPVQ